MSSGDESPRRPETAEEEDRGEGRQAETGAQHSSSLQPPRTSTKRRRDGGSADDEDDVDGDEELQDDDDDDDDDDDNDDDDGDDDDEEEGSQSRRHRHPRKKHKASQFLDVEAEVDDDEEELDEDEDDLGGEDGFIQEHDLEHEEFDVGDDRKHRDLDRQLQEITDKDAERLAEEFKNKYGRSQASRYRGDGAGVAQRLLLPSVDDPSIWAIKCKPGKEADIIVALARRNGIMRSRGQKLEITSAFQRNALEGYIYVEARKSAHVVAALKDIPNVYASNMILVPIVEMPDLLRVKQQTVDLARGAYVRIKSKSSKYVGDLAQVENIDEEGTHARLRLVPRLDLSAKANQSNRFKKSMPLSFRPPARLFNEAEVMYVPFLRLFLTAVNPVVAKISHAEAKSRPISAKTLRMDTSSKTSVSKP
jgi:transcription elongation factor SPT5